MNENEYEKQKEIAIKKLQEALPKAADALIGLLDSKSKIARVKAATAIRKIVSEEAVKTVIIIRK